MTKYISFKMDEDEFCAHLIDELKYRYVDQVKYWSKEPDAEELANALLTVIEFYSVPTEYNEWYETIKEL